MARMPTMRMMRSAMSRVTIVGVRLEDWLRASRTRRRGSEGMLAVGASRGECSERRWW